MVTRLRPICRYVVTIILLASRLSLYPHAHRSSTRWQAPMLQVRLLRHAAEMAREHVQGACGHNVLLVVQRIAKRRGLNFSALPGCAQTSFEAFAKRPYITGIQQLLFEGCGRPRTNPTCLRRGNRPCKIHDFWHVEPQAMCLADEEHNICADFFVRRAPGKIMPVVVLCFVVIEQL